MSNGHAQDIVIQGQTGNRHNFDRIRGRGGIVIQRETITRYDIPMLRPTPLALATIAIGKKYSALRGAPGQSRGEVVRFADGYVREFEGGTIYYQPYFGAFYLHGDIGAHYKQLGGPASWLGWPRSDEMDVEGGKAVEFHHGVIYWWPDTGPIALNEVVVHYKGMHCFGTTDPGGDDNPYVWLGTLPPDGAGLAVRTPIRDDIDAGDTCHDVIELYRGRPLGLGLSATFFDHDSGDPNVFLPKIQKALQDAGEVMQELDAIPLIGDVVAWLGEAMEKYSEEIADALNELFGLADDLINGVARFITVKEMVTLAIGQLQHAHELDFNIESELVSGRGASYKAFFQVSVG
jgi:hypothetical protein